MIFSKTKKLIAATVAGILLTTSLLMSSDKVTEIYLNLKHPGAPKIKDPGAWINDVRAGKYSAEEIVDFMKYPMNVQRIQNHIQSEPLGTTFSIKIEEKDGDQVHFSFESQTTNPFMSVTKVNSPTYEGEFNISTTTYDHTMHSGLNNLPAGLGEAVVGVIPDSGLHLPNMSFSEESIAEYLNDEFDKAGINVELETHDTVENYADYLPMVNEDDVASVLINVGTKVEITPEQLFTNTEKITGTGVTTSQDTINCRATEVTNNMGKFNTLNLDAPNGLHIGALTLATNNYIYGRFPLEDGDVIDLRVEPTNPMSAQIIDDTEDFAYDVCGLGGFN